MAAYGIYAYAPKPPSEERELENLLFGEESGLPGKPDGDDGRVKKTVMVNRE